MSTTRTKQPKRKRGRPRLSEAERLARHQARERALNAERRVERQMARRDRARACTLCGRPSTRRVTDDLGNPLWLCDVCPDPQQISQRAAEVRSTWPEHRWQEYQEPRVETVMIVDELAAVELVE